MSKHFAALLLTLPLILQLFNNVSSQSVDVVISLKTSPVPQAEISGRLNEATNRRNFALLNEYHGFIGLSDRVSDLKLEDESGQTVAFRRFAPGEYVADRDISSFSYRVDLKPVGPTPRSGHVSWMTDDTGLLFLRDLLPLNIGTKAAIERVTLQLPTGWTSSKGISSIKLTDAEATVAIGRNLRAESIQVGETSVNIFISGSWQFTDQEVADFASEIIKEYAGIFDGFPVSAAEVIVLPFPVKTSPGNWEADTSTDTVSIVASDMPFKTQSIQRLHEQLRHEIFHLWFPKGVSMTGRYDWFYEGFAMYQSLKTGVRLNRLRFDDFLDTLGRAITIDSMLTENRSLIDASRTRTSGNDTVIYARGMLAAFAADLVLLRRSGGRNDVSDLLKKLFQLYRKPAAPVEANQTILRLIDIPAIADYVNGGPMIWSDELRPYGIEALNDRGVTTLRVAAKPSSSQRKLLDKLGYNNWRKLSSTPK